MKKQAKILVVLLILVGMVIMPRYVRAAEEESGEQGTDITWTDASQIQFSVSKSTGDTLEEYKLNITGLTNEKSQYYIYIKNGSVPIPEYDMDGDPARQTAVISKEINYGVGLSNFTELKGDIYVTILEKQGTGMKEIVKGQKIERPSCNSLGLRMSIFFSNSGTNLEFRDPIFGEGTNSTETPRNVKVKIGKVTDTNILKSIKNNETNGLSNLLNYAKNSEAINNYTLNKGINSLLTSNLNITDGAYYYTYMLAEEDGKYYPVEDISLYQAEITTTGTKYLWNYLDENFKWNIDNNSGNSGDTKNPGIKVDDKTKAPDAKLPQTGESYIVVIMGITLIIAGVFFANKVKKYKGL